MRKLLDTVPGSAASAATELASGEVLVRATRTAFDAAAFSLLRDDARFAPGREVVGLVQAIGPGADAWNHKRVVVSPLIPCGCCDLCRRGLAIHCRDRAELGVSRDGAFAGRVAVPMSALFEIPKAVDDDRAAFVGPLGKALHAADLVRLENKAFVTIIGEDAVALLAAQVMTQRNASVRLLGRETARYGLCEKWGVKHRHIDQVGRRADQDVVFVCSETPGDLETAIRLARPRATILLLATPAHDRQPLTESALRALRENELTLIGSRAERPIDALRLLAADAVDVRSLLSAKFRLAQLPEAVSKAKNPECVRVVFDLT
ncbi:MAG: alcohol dehydrogenase catalytic domain-containing protein [Planctomycetes bacterium]|nr:alcohol dehydrogenase catalytic domain-containing protein [Planctomycetota bacterium]